MKSLHIASISLCSLLLLASACKKDDAKDEPVNLADKTYSGLTELDVNYNGSGMSSKKVAMVVNGNQATLTAEGYLDLSQLSEQAAGMPNLSAPGVLPGTPKLELKTTLKKGDGDKYNFSGNGDTDYVTYKYSGDVDASHLTLNLTDVLLKDQQYAGGVWKPAAADSSTGPFYIVWDTDMLPIPIPGLENGVGDALKMLTELPIIQVEYYGNTAEMSLAQVITSLLKTLAFGADGNLVVSYVQTSTGTTQIAQAPLSMLQYVPATSSQIKLYANPQDLISMVLINTDQQSPNIPANPFGKQHSRAISAWQMTLMQALLSIAADNTKGVPVQTPHTADTMTFYLDTAVLLPIFKNVIVPVLQDPEVQQMLLDAIAQDETMAQQQELVKLVLNMLPTLADKTTKLEFGLNLVKN